MRLGIEIAAAMVKMYPGKLDLAKMIELVGNAGTIERLTRGDSPADIVSEWNGDLDSFRKVRAKYLLYP